MQQDHALGAYVLVQLVWVEQVDLERKLELRSLLSNISTKSFIQGAINVMGTVLTSIFEICEQPVF